MNRKSLEKALFATRYANVDKDNMTDIQKVHLLFALSTNERGRHAMDIIELNGFSCKDLNVLDIGCGYGGFSIEARRCGASMVYGVDISAELIKLAKANLSDETEAIIQGCKFVKCDITSENAMALLPEKYFNFIFINDVFEHIYDTCRLLSIIDRLAAPECIMYFEIPNGCHHMDYIEKEPHSYLCGRSLLSPDYSDYKGTYYRRWQYYEALFTYWGFNDIRTVKTTSAKNNGHLIEILSQKMDKTQGTLKKTFNKDKSKLAKNVLMKFDEYKLELMYDIKNLDASQLCWKYLEAYWRGVVIRNSSTKAYATDCSLNSVAKRKNLRYVFRMGMSFLRVHGFRKTWIRALDYLRTKR